MTGDYDEIDRLRRELGVYDLDPVIDADKTQHSGVLTFGNDRTDRWVALPVLMRAEQLAMTMAFELEGSVDAGSLDVGDELEFKVTQKDGHHLITQLSALASISDLPGAADFNTYCAACHGSHGDGDGPLSALLDPKPARLSDAQIFLAIPDGGPAIGKSAGMGAWGGTLSENSIRDLVDYIRTLSR